MVGQWAGGQAGRQAGGKADGWVCAKSSSYAVGQQVVSYVTHEANACEEVMLIRRTEGGTLGGCE